MACSKTVEFFEGLSAGDDATYNKHISYGKCIACDKQVDEHDPKPKQKKLRRSTRKRKCVEKLEPEPLPKKKKKKKDSVPIPPVAITARRREKPNYYSHEIMLHPDQAFYYEDDDPNVTLDDLDGSDDELNELLVRDDNEEIDGYDSAGSLRDFISDDAYEYIDSEYILQDSD